MTKLWAAVAGWFLPEEGWKNGLAIESRNEAGLVLDGCGGGL